MHAIDQGWISGSDTVTKHADQISSLGGVTACQPCHGTDYRGTVLSRAQGDRSYNVSFDTGSFTLTLFRGATVGCYNCHNGPSGDSLNSSVPPTATSFATSTTSGQPLAVTLPGSGGTGRIISQPAHGSVGCTNRAAVYYPEPGFVGTDTFTFAAYDGMKNSTLATGTVSVAQGPYSITAVAHRPARAIPPAGRWPSA